ncbi:hydantoinase B/oxoprolinase family protein [Flexithrix dorotheae]|uniref:hydantoinase B/oxoprolinase family protein n=1 Tax=Flexithrix dorotheae TaxID=70993 RepID=UPI000376E17F|nr:hydantoinase B/oxoprolinase family protein [Flexithrix dorotheae]
MSNWKIWVDTGGTFTDCLAYSPKGELKRVKVLSSSALRGKVIQKTGPTTLSCQFNWSVEKDIFEGYDLKILGETDFHFKVASIDLEANTIEVNSTITEDFDYKEFEIFANEEAPVLAARLVTSTPLYKPFPSMEMRLGSTKGTNALLERKGAKVAFLVTSGFKDLLKIGTQARPNIFALNIQKSPVLYDEVFTVEERIDANGSVLKKIDEEALENSISIIKSKGFEAVAVALMHSYLNPAHEILIKRTCENAGMEFISLSADLSPNIKILPRAETAVVDAYLAPIIHNYLNKIKKVLGNGSLKIMTSAGGLIGADFFRPKDSLLSGPAGGVVGAAEIAKKSGYHKILTLDMGGTSTDVARYADEYDYQYESKVGDATLLSPSIAIHTVAAGGGSLCSFDGFKITVGPESAGASPGPACYGAGGGLTITDVNLLLGRLDPENFGIPVIRKFAENAFQDILNELHEQDVSSQKLLSGFLEIANEKMAEAIRKISVAKGYDPKEYALLAFGGAGGQHACAVARLLEINEIIIPYDAGLLSAFGMGQALVERFATQQILKSLPEITTILPDIISNLKEKAIHELLQEGFRKEDTQLKLIQFYLRFKGQDSPVEVEFSEGESLEKLFEKKYQQIYGHWLEGKVIEVESVKVIVSSKPVQNARNLSKVENYVPESSRNLKAFINEKWKEIPVFRWEDLKPGALIHGPSLLVSINSTTVIEEGWKLNIDEYNTAILKYQQDKKNSLTKLDEKPEAIQLELFTNRFSAIAEEMGALLQRTSFSVNIKERLDFSCALLDKNGDLVVNAPHIPVHLGSLGICVRMLKAHISMERGDVVITNHPGFGGSHLPDITLVCPVFTADNQLVGYLANRAHHAELGGKSPGSFPADAKSLAEEGVVIKPIYLVKNGVPDWKKIEEILTSGPYPTRLLSENLADLNAALASLEAGNKALLFLCQSFGVSQVQLYMQKLKDYAEKLMEQKLLSLENRNYVAREKLDDGTPLEVKIKRENNKLLVDFSGSSEHYVRNLNANPTIIRSAVIYVLRLFLDQDIPLNEGIMQNVEINIPKGILNPVFPDNPAECPPVVGGNTETSQRVVDLLLKALEMAACSQGTMNNILFGNEKFGYYETICGGTGAGNGFHGVDAVHQHMTNTRITDPEILEFRYPVRLEKFEIRKGSGGIGKWHGGNGITREITFLTAMDLTVLTQHREENPYGLEGGKPGETGAQFIKREIDKKIIKLGGIDSHKLNPGDKLIIHTPGGGGYGDPYGKT